MWRFNTISVWWEIFESLMTCSLPSATNIYAGWLLYMFSLVMLFYHITKINIDRGFNSNGGGSGYGLLQLICYLFPKHRQIYCTKFTGNCFVLDEVVGSSRRWRRPKPQLVVLSYPLLIANLLVCSFPCFEPAWVNLMENLFFEKGSTTCSSRCTMHLIAGTCDMRKSDKARSAT